MATSSARLDSKKMLGSRMMTTESITPPAQASDEPMRAAFEAKYIPSKVYRSQWNDGTDYANYETEIKWRLFKDGAAFAAATTPQPSGNTGDLAPCATAEVEQLADGYTGSTMTQDFYGSKITLRYATGAQADAAHAVLSRTIDAAIAANKQGAPDA